MKYPIKYPDIIAPVAIKLNSSIGSGNVLNTNNCEISNDDLSEEIKLITKIHLEKDKFAEISVPYRTRVGDAEINTWGDGWKNFKFFFAKRIGINKTRTEWGPLDDSLDSIKDTL